jgi:phosphoesterase RecJ-like protein
MKKEYRKLKKLIQKSSNILILTHKGPDFDGFASGLILKKYINVLYPKKIVSFKTRHYPTQKISFMHEIAISQVINLGDEDLIIIVDANSWDMCITKDDTINLTKAPIAIIDHHDTKAMESVVTVNENLSSATEQVLRFAMATGGKKFEVTEGISFLGQVGMIYDTGRFLYDNTKPETYELMAKLRRIYHLDLEDFEYKNTKFPMETLLPLKIYIHNIHIQGDMAYTYITKQDIQVNGISKMGLNTAQEFVRDKILRYIQGVHWGFVVKPYPDNENEWRISFRSTKGYQEVAKIAETLGGGGHQYAAASKIQALDGDEATKKVLEVISQVVENKESKPVQTPTPSSPSSSPTPPQSL